VSSENKDYWDRNISEWGKFYLGTSHSNESLYGPKLFVKVYRSSIGRHEAKLMNKRFNETINLLDSMVKPGVIVADIGCGTGIFTVEILRRGGTVIAVDISESSLSATREAIERLVPTAMDRVSYLQGDVEDLRLMKCDLILAVGVAPYLKDIVGFVRSSLKQSDAIYISLLDRRHWANKIRRYIPQLNVRRLQMADLAACEDAYREVGFKLESRVKLGTGVLDFVLRNRS
jgi:SAM-dependent methyltransferase